MCLKYVFFVLFLPLFCLSQEVKSGNYCIVSIKSSTIKKNNSNEFFLIILEDSLGERHLVVSPKVEVNGGEKLKIRRKYSLVLEPYFKEYFISTSPTEPLDICIDKQCLMVRRNVRKWRGLYITGNLNGIHLKN